MSGISYTTIILTTVFAVLIVSLVLSWRKRAALKPNLAQIRHETEAEILMEKEKENQKEES